MSFPIPVFDDIMTVQSPRIVGKKDKAVNLSMILDGHKAIQFFAVDNPGDPLPVKEGQKIRVAYQLQLESFRGMENPQIIVKQIL